MRITPIKPIGEVGEERRQRFYPNPLRVLKPSTPDEVDDVGYTEADRRAYEESKR